MDQLKETSVPPSASPSERSSEPCTPPSEKSCEPPHRRSQDVRETLAPTAEPCGAQPSEANHETKSDTKKNKKKESNATYYKKIREKLKQADAPSTLASPSEPDPAPTPAPTVRAKPKTKAKAQHKEERSEPYATHSERSEEPPAVSPRTRMIEAYREARLADQERKRLRYKSWFQ